MAEGAYRTVQQVTRSVVEPQQQPVQPLLHKLKWVVAVPEPPAAAKGGKGRTEGWPQQVGPQGHPALVVACCGSRRRSAVSPFPHSDCLAVTAGVGGSRALGLFLAWRWRKEDV